MNMNERFLDLLPSTFPWMPWCSTWSRMLAPSPTGLGNFFLTQWHGHINRFRAMSACCPIGLLWMPESTPSIEQWIVRAKMLNVFLCRGCECPQRASVRAGQE